MATVVHQKAEGRQATKTRQIRSYTEVYNVTLDTVAEGPREARLATGIPSIGDAHPDDASAKVMRIVPRETQDRRLFRVHVYYESRRWTVLPVDSNPLNDPVQITWSGRAATIRAQRDKDGADILNSLKEPFPSDPTDDQADQTVQIIRNEASFSPSTARAYLNSVNNASIAVAGLTLAIRQGKMTRFGGASRERNGTDYYVVTYEIEVAPEEIYFDENGVEQTVSNWDLKELDQGMAGDATEPLRLNGSGEALEDTADARTLTFRRRKEKDWSALSLPTALS